MSHKYAKTWSKIGWTAVALVALSVSLAVIDPVMGIFVMYVAIVVGGLSGIGRTATIWFGVATIIASLLFGMIGTHYTTSTGFNAPQLTFVWSAISIFALPILVSAILLLIGGLRRRSVVNPNIDI